MNKSIFLVFCLLVVAGLLFVGLRTGEQNQDDNPLVGDTSTSVAASTSPFADTDFAEVVLNADRPVIVDFTATWCPPCRQLKPILHQIEEEGLATIVEVDVDQHSGMARTFGASSIPNLLFVVDGKVYGRMVGLQSKKDLVEKLRKVKGQASKPAQGNSNP